jgi:hypothetical protein
MTQHQTPPSSLNINATTNPIKTEYVSFTFEDQKNNEKNDTRPQRRTADEVLCPVHHTASLVARILRIVLGHSSGATTINTIFVGRTVITLSQEYLTDRLRVTCTALGGKATFGYSASDIGTNALRSGATMTLFLMNHSTERIMLLGRWKSAAFLVYIRQHVLEWTNDMSRDMIHHDSFLDVSDFDRADPDLPRLRPVGSMVPPTTLSFSLRYTWSTERVGQDTPSPIINGWNLIWKWGLTFCQALPWLHQQIDSIVPIFDASI